MKLTKGCEASETPDLFVADKEESAAFIKDLNERLTEEHRKIIEVTRTSLKMMYCSPCILIVL